MKKIVIISLCLLFVGTSLAIATPEISQQILQPVDLATAGTFFGNLSIQRPGPNATIVGTVSGTYGLQNRFGQFNGTWNIANKTGTVHGRFGRHIVIGKLSVMVNGTQKSLPVIGFLAAKNGMFVGRAMSLVGPAVYFKGTYTQ